MKKIHFFGECMVELRATDDSNMHQSFAGDVYNSAVYLKRCFPNITSSIVTAVGQDNLSTKMLSRFKDERLDTDFVFRHESKAPGLYLVETDHSGERHFTYWRSQAAARKIVDFLNKDIANDLANSDMFFFSGISLAVIEPCAREQFWQMLETLKQVGVKLVFDPNYRARLWQNKQEAENQFEKALAAADIALPGVEDLTQLYEIDSASAVVEFCRDFKLDEVVVKNGQSSVLTFHDKTLLSHDITPVSKVVDTTSAGDAFNGVYLGARLSGTSISEAVSTAAAAAAIVIQHPGAIAPKAAFAPLLKSGNGAFL